MRFMKSKDCKRRKDDTVENDSSSLLKSDDTSGSHFGFFTSVAGDKEKENVEEKKKYLSDKFFLNGILSDD